MGVFETVGFKRGHEKNADMTNGYKYIRLLERITSYIVLLKGTTWKRLKGTSPDFKIIILVKLDIIGVKLYKLFKTKHTLSRVQT